MSSSKVDALSVTGAGRRIARRAGTLRCALTLGAGLLAGVHAGTWHTLKLVFQGSTINGMVDGEQVLTATNGLYPAGMAGLMAGGDRQTLSTPFYDILLIQKEDGPAPAPSFAQPGQTPMYAPVSGAAQR